MKRDIREIFKNEELPKKKLPDFHEEEFLEKLEKFNKKEQPKRFLQIFKIAASIVLIFSIGYYFLGSETEIKQENDINTALNLKAIEKTYLNEIDKEWGKLILLTKDKSVINTNYKI